MRLLVALNVDSWLDQIVRRAGEGEVGEAECR